MVSKNQKIKLFQRTEFDSNIVPFLMITLLFSFSLLNGSYIAVGLLVYLLLFYHLQIPFKPSIFTIHALYHFLQIFSGVLLCNYLNKDISYRSEFLGNATLFSYLGLCVLLLPVGYVQNKLPPLNIHKLKDYADTISIKRSFELYLIMFFVANFLNSIAFQFSGFTQILFSLKNIKWTFFILFASLVFIQRKMIPQFILICILEFLLGFFSYFSDFKTVIIYIIVASLPFIKRVLLGNIIAAIVILVIMFFLGVKWTGIKGEYRAYLNQGNKTQTVEVDRDAAFGKLMELSENKTDFNNSAVQFLDRLQYTYHLAKTMERVPSVLPYEYGNNIGGIISYVTTPRFLNPDKVTTNNSVKATKYTGIGYLGKESGVSISLGYFADCYIDFGSWGMLIPLFLLGCIYAGIYFYFSTKSTNNLIINYALVGSLFMETIIFESDGSYLLGRLFSNVVTYFLFIKFILPAIHKYIRQPQQITQ